MSRRMKSVTGWMVLCCVGCGLSEYEAQIERTQSRLAQFDQEQTLLGGALQLPSMQPRVFIQPPRGIQLTPTPKAKSVPASDWLIHYPWGNANDSLPPMELLIGVPPKGPGMPTVTRVFQEIGEALRQHAAAKQPLLVTKFEKPESYVRDSDLAPLRMPVAYLHRQFISEEKPLWPAPSRAAAPGPCVYHYDVFVDDADDSWIAVIFKQLDIGATEERWRKLPASETKDSALPSYEPSAFAQARRLSLATLRIGNAAAARFRLHGE